MSASKPSETGRTSVSNDASEPDSATSTSSTTTSTAPTKASESAPDVSKGSASQASSDELIDHATFDQLLEMDEEDDHDFSRSLVENYYEQAESTFVDMDRALEKKDIGELSRLGHFLKGSSAALGLKKVKASCEKMQHYGNCKEEDGSGSISEEEAVERITKLLTTVKAEYQEARDYLVKFYEDLEA